MIEKLFTAGHIHGAALQNIQPSSLDLTLSEELYRVEGVFLPQRGEHVRDLIDMFHAQSVTFAEPLQCHGVYLCRLNERLVLPESVYAYANNKSSTGRINLQVRLLCDGVPKFDQIPKSYCGELWILVAPHSFSIALQPGQSLNQMRFFNADTRLSEEEHRALYSFQPLLYQFDGKSFPAAEVLFDKGGGITMTIDFDQDIIGYVAFPNSAKVLDYARRDYKPEDFFEPICRLKKNQLVLNREGFYIFSTKEYIAVPPEFSVEMIAYDPTKGEFRTHYAGFFDPGWGFGARGELKGTPAVLEVYPHDHNFIFRDGQPICKMVYERLATFPDRIYGVGDLGSHYQHQRGPCLSKHFVQHAKVAASVLSQI